MLLKKSWDKRRTATRTPLKMILSTSKPNKNPRNRTQMNNQWPEKAKALQVAEDHGPTIKTANPIDTINTKNQKEAQVRVKSIITRSTRVTGDTTILRIVIDLALMRQTGVIENDIEIAMIMSHLMIHKTVRASLNSRPRKLSSKRLRKKLSKRILRKLRDKLKKVKEMTALYLSVESI